MIGNICRSAFPLVFRKLEDGHWLLAEFNELKAVLEIESVAVELPLS
jgi:hypothetical protein